MRILYVTSESPVMPAGGIGTYIGFAAQAMAELGHEVYLFSWTFNRNQALFKSPFKSDNVHIEFIKGESIWSKYPQGPYNHAFSMYISDSLLHVVNKWKIDVIEATDYQSPALMTFLRLESLQIGRSLIRSTFNHGLIEESYLAGLNTKSLAVACDLAGERQQCRVSDLVITPSNNAKNKLAKYGISTNVSIVKEPFVFDKKTVPNICRNSFTHLGRVSIAKGIDKLILLANLVDSVEEIEKILFIGKTADTPFRTRDISQYIKNRLTERVAKKVHFLGEVERSIALQMLRPGDMAPNLSFSETFSYTFLETLNHGLLPIVELGSAMSEFYPEELKKYLLDPRCSDVRKHIRQYCELKENGGEIIQKLISFNDDDLSFKKFANSMTDLYESKISIKRGVGNKSIKKKSVKPQCFTINDVTILIPAYKPTSEFYEAIDSVVAQTSGLPNIIICDDGNDADHRAVLEYVFLHFSMAKIIRQPNSGLLCARNTLIAECQTKLSLFLDSDDILNERFLERALNLFNSQANINAVLPMRMNFGESDEKILRVLIGDHTHALTNDYRMTALIETDILREIGFDGSRRNGEADDWVFWLNFTLKGHRSGTLPEFLFNYRFKNGSMSWPWSEGQRIGTQIMLQEVFEKNEDCIPALGGSVSLFNMSNRILDL